MINDTAMNEDIQDEVIPGVKFSACHVLSTSKQYETIFDLGAIIDPFYQYSNRNFASRSPIICLSCSCYLSSYAVINQENGSWYCPFCHMVNPKFHSDFSSIDPSNRIKAMRSFYEELQSRHFDYEEPVFKKNNIINKSFTDTSNILVFAIDENLCKCNETISLLKEGIFTLHPSTEICILVFGNHISILRLNGVLIGCNPVQVDVLSGLTDQSSLFLHLIKRGIYCASVSKLLNNFDIIQNCLANLVLDSSVSKCNSTNISFQSYQVECSLDMIVKLAVTLIQSKACLIGVNLVFLTCRSIYLSKQNEFVREESNAVDVTTATTSSSSMKSLVIEGYSLLGQWALGFGCSVDVYYASMNTGNLDHLDALACISGGSIVLANSYSEAQFRKSFIQLLSYNTRYSDFTSTIHNESSGCFEISNLTMPTLEVRTCGRLEVDRLIGPIATTHDVLLHNACKSSSYNEANMNNINSIFNQKESINKAAELTVDPSHVSHSLFFAVNNKGSNDKMKSIENSQEEVYKRLVDFSSKNIILCGIAARPVIIPGAKSFQETNISVQFKPSKVIEDGESIDSSDEAAYVQFVVRYQIRRRSAGVRASFHHDTLMKVTRVWTQRLAITHEMDEYIQGIDSKLWTYVISKEIVADYQSEIIESFGGVVRKMKLNDAGIYTYIPIRSNVMKRIEQLIIDISLFWCGIAVNSSEISSTYTYIQKVKINESCRILYHLLHGPLLDGPSMQPMESYLLRTSFLRASYKHGICMIIPSLKLSTILLLQKQYSRLIDMKDSASHTLVAENLPIHSNNSSNITYSAPNNITNNSNNNYNNDTTYKSLIRSFGKLGLIEVHPDTTCLFPGTISLLDAGDRIIIRENSINDDEANHTTHQTSEELQQKNEIFELLQVVANKQASSRYPSPSIHVLKVPCSPQDRLLYSCLAPSHMNESIEQLLENTHLKVSSKLSIPISKSDLELIIKQAPITDQLSFNKYMQATISNEMFDKLTINNNIKPLNIISLSQLDDRSTVDIINADMLRMASASRIPASLSMERELPIANHMKTTYIDATDKHTIIDDDYNNNNNNNSNLFSFFSNTTIKTISNKTESLANMHDITLINGNMHNTNTDFKSTSEELDVV